MADAGAAGNGANGSDAADASSAARSRFFRKLLEARNFGLIIGLFVFGVVLVVTFGTVLVRERLEVAWLDFNFSYKTRARTETIQEGVVFAERNVNVSPDIMLVGIDDRTLGRLGRFPFPRYHHADLVSNLANIQQQETRENALFIDVFFIERDRAAEDDARLVEAIADNGRVFLETSLQRNESPPEVAEDYFDRHEVLYGNYGTLTNIEGDWAEVTTFFGGEPPLKPYGRAVAGYGHANFVQDQDETFRRQPLVVRLAEQVDEVALDELTVDYPLDEELFEQLAWRDREGLNHDVPFPLTEAVLRALERDVRRDAPVRLEDTDGDGEADVERFYLKKYRNSFLPSITLALAANYFGKTLDDLEIVLGSHILIPDISVYDPESGTRVPYQIMTKLPETDSEGEIVREAEHRGLGELRIPIDETGQMLVNFMGIRSSSSAQEHQTFPVRSYSGYTAARNPDRAPPRTLRLDNKILMVGAFAQGIGDEKDTPFGLMFGVEIHANALNTILMDNFLVSAPDWVGIVALLVLIMLTAYLTSRFSTLLALGVWLVAAVGYGTATLVLFDLNNLVLPFFPIEIGMGLTLIATITYRVVSEQRDKRQIRDMFGKYVSPTVVDEIMQDPPELGGVDKELTVFFSDIRGFTTLSESMSPQELVNHLNIYLGAMTDLILEYQGTLDKYVGDEIMCFWGAPLPQDDHAYLACKCALHQMQTLRQLNDSWPEERRIDIGIGVNTGIMTVGNMGSTGRMNYTLMGDDVNLGARLEGTNKQYLTNIIISENTYEHVKDRVIARELDNIRVKGKNKPVVIYELIDVIDDEIGANGASENGSSAAGAETAAAGAPAAS